MNCAQCFYNRPGAYYVPIDKPHVPTPEEVGDGIVRMNCGNDSNNNRDLVIDTALKYGRFFFNTSIPNYDFPGPVVLTANPREEVESEYAWPIWHRERWYLAGRQLDVRAAPHVGNESASVDKAVAAWTAADVPVVITFMAYYDREPNVPATCSRPCGNLATSGASGTSTRTGARPKPSCVGSWPLQVQSAGVHVRQHRHALLPGLPELRNALSANHEATAIGMMGTEVVQLTSVWEGDDGSFLDACLAFTRRGRLNASWTARSMRDGFGKDHGSVNL